MLILHHQLDIGCLFGPKNFEESSCQIPDPSIYFGVKLLLRLRRVSIVINDI